MDLAAIQHALTELNLDGWLLCDFHNRDVIARRILQLPEHRFATRRWYYFIPREGEPSKIVSRVENTFLDTLPGKKHIYLSWKELHLTLQKVLGQGGRIALNYSPLNHVPHVSIIDGGTLELLESFGYQIESAADLIQMFEARLTPAQFQTHRQAGERVQRIKDEAFAEIARAVGGGETLTEYELQQFIVRRFQEEGLTCDQHAPIVGINEHPADPHFEPQPQDAYSFRPGNTVLIDLWARLDQPESVYYDITWCGFVGKKPPRKYKKIFQVVRDAREAALEFIQNKLATQEPCYGWEVDDACRSVVETAGFGEFHWYRSPWQRR